MKIEASYNAYPELLKESHHNYWLSTYSNQGAICTRLALHTLHTESALTLGGNLVDLAVLDAMYRVEY